MQQQRTDFTFKNQKKEALIESCLDQTGFCPHVKVDLHFQNNRKTRGRRDCLMKRIHTGAKCRRILVVYCNEKGLFYDRFDQSSFI